MIFPEIDWQFSGKSENFSIKMSQISTLSGEINLPYYKQGDDLDQVKVIANGHVDARATLLAHIELLTLSIEKLRKIHDLLPDNNTVNLAGDCHYISITGEQSVIETLEKNGLVTVDHSDESEDDLDGDYEDDSQNDDSGAK